MSFINWGSESPEQLRIRKLLEEQMLLEQAMQSAATAAAAAAGTGSLPADKSIVYLRAFDSSGEDSNTEPWADSENLTTNNIDEMNAVFGKRGWVLRIFETCIPEEVFSLATNYVFIDGSDAGAEELSTFLSDNHEIIENWVYNGGKLFLNAAPNEGGNINFGFGGTTLAYSANSDDATIVTGQENHPIFTGPGNCGDAWTGDSFAHATIDGDITALIVNPGEYIICGEIIWGDGKVIFGGMTITQFHDPQPEATYLRQNIHSYLSGKSYTPQLGMRRSMVSSEEARRSSKG